MLRTKLLRCRRTGPTRAGLLDSFAIDHENQRLLSRNDGRTTMGGDP